MNASAQEIARFDVDVTLDFPAPHTRRARELMALFGLCRQRLHRYRLRHRCRLRVRRGDIIYITGASGAGKSVLLNALCEQIDPAERLRLERIALDGDRALIDCLDEPPFAAFQRFSRVGLGDVFCLLLPPSALSTGQQYRCRLACALAAPQRFIFADAFTDALDRISAAGVAYRLRRQADRSGKVFVLASSHEDILPDLRPDILIIKNLAGPPQTLYRDRTREPSRQAGFVNGESS